MRVLDPIEFQANTDGQRYNAVFEKPLDQYPNSCTIYIRGCRVGEATWHGESEGLMDRFPDNPNNPVKAWNEVCDRIEREVNYRLQGMAQAAKVPTFRTARDHLLRYRNGVWTDGTATYGAAIVTGFPEDDDGTLVEGTFITEARKAK